MIRYWLVGPAAFALMTGVALAQITWGTTTSTQSTTTTAPVTGGYSESNTQSSIDSNGTQTDKNQTYKSGPNGTNATAITQTTSQDGSQKSTTREDQNISPTGATTTDKTTTTTKIR